MSELTSSGDNASHWDEHTIELALVLTGTVSAGAYSAGVMDVLLRALRRYSELPDAPHRVRIKALAGSSGGAMTLFLSGLWAYQAAWPPMSQLSRNPLYHYWVERIDASLLLGLDDLQQPSGTTPLSLLNSQALVELTQEALTGYQPRPGSSQPEWLHPECQLSITSTALSGIPYHVGSNTGGLSMPYYGDVHQIMLTPNLEPRDWEHIRQCANASAAFPLAFSPQFLSHPKHQALTLIPDLTPDPQWLNAPPSEYQSWHIDGGVVNNSPVEVARQYLAGSPTTCNPRFADQAHRITLLISPFNAAARPPLEDVLALTQLSPLKQLLTQASQIVQVMLGQSRFKWDELRLACDTDIYSRFLISPARNTSLYSHLLGAFGGFLSQTFRHHDYVLGQCHAQAFLQHELLLPESNPVFKGWSDEDKQHWQRPSKSYLHSIGHSQTERFFPVIPLVGRELSTPIVLPKRPSALGSVDLSKLTSALEARMKRLAKRLMPSHLTGIQRITWALIQPVVIKAILEALSTEITRGLTRIEP